MKRLFLPVLLVSVLTGCNSRESTDELADDTDVQSTITIAADTQPSLTNLPNVSFNGEHQTVAQTGSGTSGDSAVETDSAGLTASIPAAADGDSSTVADIMPGPIDPNPPSITPGTLTAGDYDDHLNPHLYQDYAHDYLQQRGQWIDIPRLDFNQRIRIEVTGEDGLPYADARVDITGGQSAVTLYTSASGMTSLYSGLDNLPENFTVRVTGVDGTSVERQINRQQALEAGRVLVYLATSEQEQNTSAQIDLMLVIDTTGSMADELNFLQTELTDIIDSINIQQSGIRTGLVFYRDYGDNYLVRTHGFSDNPNSVQLNLNQEQASGGGDYPEAMDQALQAATDADWRADSRKVMFLIADAPPHSDRMRATWNAAQQAREKNIHIVPIAASGVAEDAEYIMRSVAALTNSRYLFLTDDSGFGNPHAEPEIDCYVVTSLRAAMIRALNTLTTGLRIEPTENDIIRTVGNYDQGICRDDESRGPNLNTTILIERNVLLNGTYTQKQTRALDNQNDFDAVLLDYGEEAFSVDFDAGSVLLVDSGQRNTGGYSIDVSSVEEFGDHVVANIVFRQPGSDCVVTTALTNPFKFVYVPTKKEIRTVETIVSIEC